MDGKKALPKNYVEVEKYMRRAIHDHFDLGVFPASSSLRGWMSLDAKRQWAKKQKLKFLPRVHNIAPFFTGDEAEVTIPLKSITSFLQDLKAIKQMRIIKGFKSKSFL